MTRHVDVSPLQRGDIHMTQVILLLEISLSFAKLQIGSPNFTISSKRRQRFDAEVSGVDCSDRAIALDGLPDNQITSVLLGGTQTPLSITV